MEPAHVDKIVEILISDECFVKDWKKFKNKLGLNRTGSFEPIENQYKNGTLTVYELFHKIITQWVSAEGSKATIESLSKALDDLGCQLLKGKLKISFPNKIHSQNSNIFNNVNEPIFNFIGRNKELENLNLFYQDPKTFIVRMIGMGGVGKSELVKTFATNKSNETNVIWVNGESSNFLRTSLISIAESVGINLSNEIVKTVSEIFKSIMNVIQNKNHFRSTIIIDNVDTDNSDVKPLTQYALQFKCFVIVTSRNNKVLENAGKCLKLEVLEESDAHELIRQAVNEDTQDDIKKLCVLLHNLPLALQQAIAFINAEQETGLMGSAYKIQNYLTKYEQQKDTMLDFQLNSFEHVYEGTTYVTWNISIDKIKTLGATGDLAVDLLHMMSYLRADGIRIELIVDMRKSTMLHKKRENNKRDGGIWKTVKQFFGCTTDTEFTVNEENINEEIVRSALQLLKQFLLIKIEANVISIHRLVQEVTRLTSFKANQEIASLQKYTRFASKIITKLKNPDITHIISLWSYTCKHPNLIKEYPYFAYTISNQLENLSIYNEMDRFSMENYTLLEKVLGSSHMETLRMDQSWAVAMMWNGKYAESLEKYEILVPKCKTILGEEHELTMAGSHNMAIVLDDLERYDEAFSLYKSVLELKKKVFGENHASTMRTKHGLAGVLSKKGQIQEAMSLHAEVLKWRESNLGAEASATLLSIHNIAHCHFQLKEFEKAKEMFTSLLQTKIKVLGEEHSETPASESMLADTLCRLGESEAGLRMMRLVLVSQEKVLVPQHPRTIITRNNISYYSKLNN